MLTGVSVKLLDDRINLNLNCCFFIYVTDWHLTRLLSEIHYRRNIIFPFVTFELNLELTFTKNQFI